MDIKRVGDHTIWKCVYSGAIHCAVAWTVYAIVECWFSTILPWIIKPGYAYVPLHWEFTVLLLFVLYPIFGLIVGGLSALCIRTVSGRIPFLQNAQSTEIFQASAISTVVLAFAINLVFQFHVKLTVSALLLISILLILGMASSAGSGIWSRRLRFITNPWTTSILLLGLSYITLELFHKALIKGVSSLIYIVTLFLISFYIHKIVSSCLINKPARVISVFPIKSFTFLAILVFVVIGISFFLKQAPLMDASHLKTSDLKSDQPNVILITMDTVRADHLSLYGYERDTTPNLRKFSKEATLYTHAIASGNMTLSTHASIFTGIYPRSHGAHFDVPEYPGGRPLGDKFHTLAEILSEKGYLTMGVVANYGFLSKKFQIDQGFQYYDSRAYVTFLAPIRKYFLSQNIRNILLYFAPRTRTFIDKVYYSSENINSKVFSLLNLVKDNNNPFFLFINYMDAHDPYLPPHPFDTLYPGKDKTFTTAKYNTLEKQIVKCERTIYENEYNHLISQYDGGIAYLDHNIGKLITQLKKIDLYNNSIVIITSDHGEAFGEKCCFRHGISVYQDQVFIPLVIKYPNNNKKSKVNMLVSVVDIMPTVLDVLGYKIADDVQGKSLKGIKKSKSRIVISETHPNSTLLTWHPRFDRIERAIFSEHYKFINSTKGKRELYDLSKDPNEKKNLYKTNDIKSMELEAELNQWLKDTKEESGSATKLDKDALERLKALGYIQ